MHIQDVATLPKLEVPWTKHCELNTTHKMWYAVEKPWNLHIFRTNNIMDFGTVWSFWNCMEILKNWILDTNIFASTHVHAQKSNLQPGKNESGASTRKTKWMDFGDYIELDTLHNSSRSLTHKHLDNMIGLNILWKFLVVGKCYNLFCLWSFFQIGKCS